MRNGSTLVYSSPYARALQTALPLVAQLGAPLRVEPLLSEDRQEGTPHQPRHERPSEGAAADWAAIEGAWDRRYGAARHPDAGGQ